MTGWRLLTYADKTNGCQAGVLWEDRVYPASLLLQLEAALSVLDILNGWEANRPAINQALTSLRSRSGLALAEVSLRAPILYPPAIYVSGGAYESHAREMAELAGRPFTKARVDDPFFTIRPAQHTIIGPHEDIVYPKFTQKLDWEAELGVVIGRETYEVGEDDAMASVAGYVICNDLSARDFIRREGMPNQIIHDWFAQKCFPGSMPMGPWITPAEFVDPTQVPIRLWVNEVVKHDSSTAEMVFSIPEMISYLSRHVRLLPGDVISTGCPAGVGVAKGDFLQLGDIIRMDFGICGTMTHRVT